MVTEEQIIRRCRGDPGALGQLTPMVASIKQNLTAAGASEPIGAVVADAGYWIAKKSVSVTQGPELFIATRTQRARAQPPLPRTGRNRASATALQLMESKVKTKRGRAIYNEGPLSSPSSARSKRSVERDVSSDEGSARSTANISCSPATHNSSKIWRMRPATR